MCRFSNASVVGSPLKSRTSLAIDIWAVPGMISFLLNFLHPQRKLLTDKMQMPLLLLEGYLALTLTALVLRNHR